MYAEAAALLLLLTCSVFAQGGETDCAEFRDSCLHVLEEPPLDVSIDSDGNLYLLLPGIPHLRIISRDGSASELDLQDVVLPGGLFVDERWGWLVSDLMSDRIFRFDPTGTVVDSWTAGSSPGDICMAGLSIAFVSRSDGAVRTVDDPDDILLRLEGDCRGSLTSSGRMVVYSDGSESVLLDLNQVPVQLPGPGTWALSAGNLMLLRDDSLFLQQDGGMVPVRSDAEFSRLSSSIGGLWKVLWSPDGREVLVLR